MSPHALVFSPSPLWIESRVITKPVGGRFENDPRQVVQKFPPALWVAWIVLISPDKPPIPFARKSERLTVSKGMSPARCLIPEGSDAALDLRQPIRAASLSLTQGCSCRGVEPLLPAAPELLAILVSRTSLGMTLRAEKAPDLRRLSCGIGNAIWVALCSFLATECLDISVCCWPTRRISCSGAVERTRTSTGRPASTSS
jgi:hypothetical protein